MYYTKNPKDTHPELMENALGCYSKQTATIQKETFQSIIKDSFSADEEKADKIFVDIQENLNTMVDEYNSENVFIYADPPYHHSRRTNVRYKVDMDNEQQKVFIDKIIDSKSKILLSGYDNEEYKRLTLNKNWYRIDFDVHTVDGKERPKTKHKTMNPPTNFANVLIYPSLIIYSLMITLPHR
jgi:site-specific DNA-adenine methylase